MSTSRSISTTTPRSTRATRGTTAKTPARRRRSALIALLGTLATAALLLGTAACGSDAILTNTDTATGADPAEPTTAPATQADPAPADPAPTAQADPAPAAPQGAPADIMRQATAAWRTQDWARLGEFATADVVAAAQTAGSPADEGPLELIGDDLDNAWRCSLDGTSCTEGLWACDSGGTSCTGQILYGHEPDADCCAAIYRVTVTDAGNGFQVTSLSFAGDAG